MKTDRSIDHFVGGGVGVVPGVARAQGYGHRRRHRLRPRFRPLSQPTRSQMSWRRHRRRLKSNEVAEQPVKFPSTGLHRVVLETQRALPGNLCCRETRRALAAIERATGKVNVLLARNPSAALIPVDATVQVIDLAPSMRVRSRIRAGRLPALRAGHRRRGCCSTG